MDGIRIFGKSEVSYVRECGEMQNAIVDLAQLHVSMSRR